MRLNCCGEMKVVLPNKGNGGMRLSPYRACWDMRSDPFNAASYPDEPRPYPLWWDYFNGVLVALVMVVTAGTVVTWMIGVTLTVLK